MGLCDWLFEKEIDEIPPEEIEPERNDGPEYKLKNSLMTKTEKDFYLAIYQALPDNYILQPQVNLATIIKKIDNKPFQNELFRNIDFCIFDFDFKPIALIEINDKTHSTQRSRQARDYKVKEICLKANIPLITFWTSYGINQEYINKRIKEVLNTI